MEKKEWEKLESLIGAYLEEIDPKSRPTRGSGRFDEIADVLSKYFYIECKYRNTKSITIKDTVWRKLCNQIPIGSQKIPIYILQNKLKDIWVVMGIKDFLRVVRRQND